MTVDALMDAREAARTLGVSVPTINRWAREGRLVETVKGDGPRGPRFFARGAVESLRDERAGLHS